MSDSDSSREEDEVEGPHDKEWQDVMNDSSLLSFLNFSECSVEENIDIAIMVESILSSHMVVED